MCQMGSTNTNLSIPWVWSLSKHLEEDKEGEGEESGALIDGGLTQTFAKRCFLISPADPPLPKKMDGWMLFDLAEFVEVGPTDPDRSTVTGFAPIHLESICFKNQGNQSVFWPTFPLEERR